MPGGGDRSSARGADAAPGSGGEPGPTPASADSLIAHFFRHQYGPLLARLLRRFGPAHLDLAEEAIGEAMCRAVRLWPLRGIPQQPEAWLWRVACNCAIDQLRRESREDGGRLERELEADALLTGGRQAMRGEAGDRPAEHALAVEAESGLGDEVLAMMFMCCHPAFSRATRAALTLQAVAGFGAAEIARAFLLPKATLAQRLVRAKRRIREGAVGLALPPPDRLEGRLDAVLDAIYLIFNEGYSRYGDEPECRSGAPDAPGPGAAGDRSLGPAPFGRELIDEALRLAELLSRHPAGQAPQVDALLALMLFQSSRLEARLDDATGALIPLAEQDRRRWDRRRIEAGLDRLSRAARGQRLSSFHLLAGIAACHATAPSAEATDWPRILGYYDALVETGGADPVLRANRAVALSMVEGPAPALAELEALEREPQSRRYAQLPALRAALLERLGEREAAAEAYARAADVAPSSAARQALLRRAGAPAPPPVAAPD